MREKLEKILIFLLKRIPFYLLIIGIILTWTVNNKIYYPAKKLEFVYVEKQDVYFTTDDKIKLNAWYVKAKQDKPTIIFCHGNGGNIAYFQDFVEFAHKNGYGILSFDYRGYGNSEGKPNEKGLYKDLKAAVNYLKAEQNIQEREIILWGLSLGGGVVAEIAAQDYNFKGVILQSTFTSVKDVANHVIPVLDIIPVFQRFETKNKVNKIKCPLLIGHAMPDDVIPYEMSVELAKLNPNAELFISEKGSHNVYNWFFPKANEFIKTLR